MLLLVGAIGVAGGILFFSTAPDPTALPPTQIQSPVLQALEVRKRPISSKVLVPGLLQPSRNVELFAEVDGRVVEVGAHELDRVEADQLLMFMDPLLAEVAVQRARASIARLAIVASSKSRPRRTKTAAASEGTNGLTLPAAQS